MHSRTLSAVPLLLSLAKAQVEVRPGSAHSNVRENFLYSCLELECPIEEQSRRTFCKLDNQTLLAVGMAQTDAAEVAPGANFTWTVGHNQHKIDGPNAGAMNIERVYYMGKQFDVEDNTHGCAFYMVKERNNENIFPRPAGDFFAQKDPSMCRTTYLQGNDPENNPGSCAKTLNEIFQNSTANVANNNTQFSQDACQQIADDVWEYMANTETLNKTGCSIAFDGPKKALIRGHPITGEYAEEPIPTAENASWACYPTLPKTNELTRVFSYNISVNTFGYETLMNAFDGETPVWTAYWKSDPAQENATEVKKEDVWLDMVCLRSLDMHKAMNETMSNGTPNGGLSMVGDASQVRAVMGVVVALVAGNYLL